MKRMDRLMRVRGGSQLGLVVVVGVFALVGVIYWLVFPYSKIPTPTSWRYLLLALIVLAWIWITGVRFIQTLYHLENFTQANNYLLAAAFSLNLPYLVVHEQAPPQEPVDEDEDLVLPDAAQTNLLRRIGGPGILIIPEDTVACIEKVEGSAYALGTGMRLIPAGHTIKDVINLLERVAPAMDVNAVTKDGIAIKVQDVRYQYRLATGIDPLQGPLRKMTNPYPFLREAVISAVYNCTMTSAGLQTWDQSVQMLVDTTISDYVQTRRLDELLLSSVGDDTRSAILSNFFSEKGRAKFKEKGAELSNIDIGVFVTPQKGVVEQQIMNWKDRWDAVGRIGQAEVEAKRLELEEIARAEAVAQMLLSISQAYQEVGLPGEVHKGIQSLNLLGLARLLQTLHDQAAGVKDRPAEGELPPGGKRRTGRLSAHSKPLREK